ncbi:MAG: 1,4-alpha-glucan branching protein GlgB [Oscillospiraceae bacterium]|nr:1,4-alpha-glucan branching protein GlgB [Oscillospiraceae bacterium]
MDKKLMQYIPQNDIYLFNTGNAQKAWLCFGCRYIPEIGLHRFLLWAPNARAVSLVGEFNGWDPAATPMERVEGGVWAVFVENIGLGGLYKYAVTQASGKVVWKTDPFAAWAQNGSDNAAMVYDDHYEWTDGAYMKKRAKRDFMHSPMSIYELHAGSWKPFSYERAQYRDLADELAAYCKEMGYTHVELMPLMEYPFDASWGYQVTGYYAPTSRYGRPEDFAYLVDRLHRDDIGVIMDWVPAHFPRDEHGLANFDGTPLFECKEKRMAEHPEWGTLIFDYASNQVQSFLISSACKFFEEYHIDGIRVDAVSSMLYLNYGRRDGEYTPNREGGYINLDAVAFLQKLNRTILVNYPGAITIAEESTAFPLITAPPENGGLGFCFKWDMGFMHDTLDYMQLDPYFRSFNHDRLTFSMMYTFSENYILAYSHDEVVHGKYSMINKMSGDYDQKFASLRTLYGYQFAHPGKKLTFMGSEFGQFIEWNWAQPLDWLLLDYPKHEALRQYCRELNRLYTAEDVFYRCDNSWDGFRWLNVNDRDRSTIAFLRTYPGAEHGIVCVCNFTPNRYDEFVIGLPQASTLREVLNSDDERYGGGGVKNSGTIYSHHIGFLDMEHSAKITVPPMSCVYFRYRPKKQHLHH